LNIRINLHDTVFEHDLPGQRDTAHMVNQFYETDEVVFEEREDIQIEIVLRLRHPQTGVVEAHALLHDRTSGVTREATFRKPIEDGLSETLYKRRTKPALLRALHDALEQQTGDHQPWGILSGVRPMKLVHMMLAKGTPLAEIRETLRYEYLISPERIELLLQIADAQSEAVPDLYNIEREVSLYIGIPFCPTHCAYCTFPAYSMEDKATYAPSFLDALEKEFRAVGAFLHEHQVPVTTVYVGGGTPTSLRAPELDRVFRALYENIPGADTWRELTVEAGRPDTITPERIEVMRRHKVNRISVNPQTFKAETLKVIGRGHTPDIVDKRFYMVQEAGFENINMDMIIGLPGETVEDVRHTRDRIGALNPDSVTVHTLQFKRTATVNKERDAYAIPETPEVRQMMRETQEWAASLGQRPYYVYRARDILGNLENIGYARPGKESIYNVCIMEERQTIIGLGGGASTKLYNYHQDGHLQHIYNAKEPKAYVDTVDAMIQKKLQALSEIFAVAPRA